MHTFFSRTLLIILRGIAALCVLLCFAESLFAQNETDSLKKLIRKAKDDTTRLQAMNQLSRQFFFTGNNDSAFYYANKTKNSASQLLSAKSDTREAIMLLGIKKQLGRANSNIGNVNHSLGKYPDALKYYQAALAIQKEIDDKQGIAISYNNIGLVYHYQGNYAEAMKNHEEALEIRKAIEDKNGIAMSYHNIGLVYEIQGFYPEALKNELASLSIRESMGNKQGTANSYNGVGSIYYRQRNFPAALKNFMTALEIQKRIDDQQGMANSYVGMGNVYSGLNNYTEALKSHEAALRIQTAIGDQQGIAVSYHNIGNLKKDAGNYAESIKNHLHALAIETEIGDKEGIAISYISIGNMYVAQKKFAEAGISLEKGLAISMEIKSVEIIKSAYEGLANLYEQKKDFATAHLYFKKFIVYRDSLFNETNTQKTVRAEMNYQFEKKEQAVKLEHEKEQALATTKNRNQRNIFMLSVCFVLGFSGLAYNRSRIKNRALLDKEKHKQQQVLLEGRLEGEEKERKRIAQELHDSVGSQLTYIISQLDYASAVASQQGNIEEKVQNIGENARELMQMLRETIWAIQKDSLSLQDFNEKITELLSRYSSVFPQMKFSFDFQGSPDVLLKPVQLLNLFRIIQEAVNNTIKHAQASQVTIQMQMPADKLLLTIADNGVGIKEYAEGEHNGIKNMKARAEAMMSTLEITSAPQKGTILKIEVPFM